MIFKKILPQIFLRRRLPKISATPQDEAFKIFRRSLHNNFKANIIQNYEQDEILSNNLCLLITNYIMYVQREESNEEQKREKIQFFIYGFLGEFLKESKIADAVAKITKQLECYEVSSK
jgi:hypothetical protein